MYAVFQDGDKQYRAELGLTITLEKKHLSPGSELEFDRVLLLRTDDKLLVGTPTVEGAKVLAQVKDEIKGKRSSFSSTKSVRDTTGKRDTGSITLALP